MKVEMLQYRLSLSIYHKITNYTILRLLSVTLLNELHRISIIKTLIKLLFDKAQRRRLNVWPIQRKRNWKQFVLNASHVTPLYLSDLLSRFGLSAPFVIDTPLSWMDLRDRGLIRLWHNLIRLLLLRRLSNKTTTK